MSHKEESSKQTKFRLFSAERFAGDKQIIDNSVERSAKKMHAEEQSGGDEVGNARTVSGIVLVTSVYGSDTLKHRHTPYK